jgi:hypothetical protein
MAMTTFRAISRVVAATSAMAILVVGCAGPAAQGAGSASCIPSAPLAGTRIEDQPNGFAVTLPSGWAQIDMASAEVTPAFKALAMEPGTAALAKAIASGAQGREFEFFSLDLAPGPDGHQSATPADLLIDVSPAEGDDLDALAGRLTTGLRAGGVTGEITQRKLTLVGGDALSVRASAETQDLSGRAVTAVQTYILGVRGDTEFTLAFSVDADHEAAAAPLFDAITRSFEFPIGTKSGC